MICLRARSTEQKKEKREKIMRTALDMLSKHAYDDIDMASIAKKAEVAKGTIYLYFASKEELFLSIYEQELALWMIQIHNKLAPLTKNITPNPDLAIAHTVALIESNPQLIQLLTLLHTILEHNISVERAAEFKLHLAENLAPATQLIEKTFDLPQEEGLTILFYINALTIGLYPMAYPAPAVRRALQSNSKLKPFDISFPSYFQLALSAICNELRNYRR